MDRVLSGMKEVGVTPLQLLLFFPMFLDVFSARVPEHNHCNCFK